VARGSIPPDASASCVSLEQCRIPNVSNSEPLDFAKESSGATVYVEKDGFDYEAVTFEGSHKTVS
jgi:hypothetical protein